MTIHLPAELESRLNAEAAARGLDAGNYALRLIEQSLPVLNSASRSLWDMLSPEDWSKAFDEWSHSHDPSLPLLSEEAVSRESFYEDHR